MSRSFIRGEGLIPRPLGRFKRVLNPSPIPYENNIPRPFRAGLLILVSVLLIFVASSQLLAQERPVSRSGASSERQGSNQGLRRRSLAIDINTRVTEGENIVWDQSERRTTISGNPVGMRLVGSNLVVAVQFTPFIRRGQQNVLVAHGQIWIQTPQGAMNYYTSIQTIPMELNEPIYFFPLGTENSSIQITLTVSPNREAVITEEATETNDN